MSQRGAVNDVLSAIPEHKINQGFLDKDDAEKLIALKSKLDRLAVIPGTDGRYTVYSLIDAPRNQITKQVTTGMIGYLMFAVSRFMLPEGIPPTEVEDYLKDKKCIKPHNKITDLELLKKYAQNEYIMHNIRVPIYAYLEHMFRYNPNKHVRSAMSPSSVDTSRILLETECAMEAYKELLNDKQYSFLKDDPRYKAIAEHETNNKKLQTGKTIGKILKARKGGKDGVIGNNIKQLNVKQVGSKNISSDLYNHKPTPEEELMIKKYPEELLRFIPPIDLYSNFNSYFTQHYEDITELASHIYCEKHYKSMLHIYGIFDTEEDAKKFIDKHADEFNICTAKICETGKWIVQGPYIQNRENIYSPADQGLILKDILKQHSADEASAQSIMKHKISENKYKDLKAIKQSDKSEEKSDLRTIEKKLEENEAFKAFKGLSDMTNYSTSNDVVDASLLDVTKFENATLPAALSDINKRVGELVVDTDKMERRVIEENPVENDVPLDVVQVPIFSASGDTIKTTYQYIEATTKEDLVDAKQNRTLPSRSTNT